MAIVTKNPTTQPAQPLSPRETQTLVRGYNSQLDSSVKLDQRGKQLPAKKGPLLKSLGKKALALGVATGVTLGVLHNSEKKSVPTVTAVVQQNDSPQSMVDRFNDETVNVPKLADEMLEQSNVRDGLIPGERVRVPVQSPETQDQQVKP
jgi:hypothetical protein